MECAALWGVKNVHKYEIGNDQAKRFAIECYDIIISEIKAEKEQEKEAIDVAAEKGTAIARA